MWNATEWFPRVLIWPRPSSPLLVLSPNTVISVTVLYLRGRRPRPGPTRRRRSLCRWKRRPGSSHRGSAPSSAPGTSPHRCWQSGRGWTGPARHWWCLSTQEDAEISKVKGQRQTFPSNRDSPWFFSPWSWCCECPWTGCPGRWHQWPWHDWRSETITHAFLTVHPAEQC